MWIEVLNSDIHLALFLKIPLILTGLPTWFSSLIFLFFLLGKLNRDLWIFIQFRHCWESSALFELYIRPNSFVFGGVLFLEQNYLLFDLFMLEQIFNTRPFFCFFSQQFIHEFFDFFTVLLWQGFCLLKKDHGHNTVDKLTRKRLVKLDNFVKGTSQHPDLGFVIVFSALANFRWEIVRGPCLSFSQLTSIFQLLRNPKITQFQQAILTQKNITRLNIPVQYLLCLEMQKCQNHLSCSVPYNHLRKCCLFFDGLLYFLWEITIICEFHYHIEHPLLVKSFVKLDYVRVVYFFHHIDFTYISRDSFFDLSLPLGHLLYSEQFIIFLSFYKSNVAKTSPPDFSFPLEFLHF